MQIASAPIASALKISVPRRNPPSTNTGTRPPIASTTSGNESIVARRLSIARPPWFDTIKPSTPCSNARVASSCVTIPFKTTRIEVRFLSRSTKSQSIWGARVLLMADRSRPSNIGLRLTDPAIPGSWQSKQSGFVARWNRSSASRLLFGRSTVSATAGQPASSARRTSASVIRQSSVG